MAAVVTLTTDFGLTDGYVAAMKGVILGINPEVTLVDISHNITPQNISQAAFVLSTVYPCFPRETIHLVVVDPGVGTERRAIILRTPVASFVAPDNGVLSYVIRGLATRPLAGETSINLAELEPGLEAVALTEPRFWRQPVSATFHGRDILAPVAGRLSLGLPPINFGEAVTSVTVLPLPHPYQAADGSLVGHIMHIDHFGNLITNIKGKDLPPARLPLTIEVGNQVITGLSRTYAEANGLLAVMGSSGYLEVSMKEGSAAARLNAEVGNEVRLRQQPGGKP